MPRQGLEVPEIGAQRRFRRSGGVLWTGSDRCWWTQRWLWRVCGLPTGSGSGLVVGRTPSAPGGRPFISNTRLSEVEKAFLDDQRGLLDEASYWRKLLHAERKRVREERAALNPLRLKKHQQPEI